MKNIEVEVRGPISKDQYPKLVNFFRKNGKYKVGKNRILIDYSTFLPKEGIRERKRDIRIRVTNGIPEIIVKLGNWGGSENRKELSLTVGKGEFDKLAQIFAALGFTKGVLCVRNSQVFSYKNVEFALVEVPNHSYYYEAEKMVSENQDKATATRSIKTVIAKLGLTAFTDDDFFHYINTLNKEANEVFDFKNYKENYFKKRFKLP